MIQLEAIHIASPCRADWNKMRGDDQVRHCASCAKNVYNLSAMTRDDATRLIREKEGDLCVQLHRRSDGTVITSDCAVGVEKRNRSTRRAARFFAAIAAAILSSFGVQTVQAAPESGANQSVIVTAGEARVVTRGEAVTMGLPTSSTPARPEMGSPRVDQTATVRGRFVVPPTPTAPPTKKATVKKSGKNHGKRNSGNAKRGAKAKSNR